MDKNRQQLRDEMTGLLIRGGGIGLAIFAVAIAFIAIPTQIGKIWPTEFTQTGYRGTGMEVIRFQADAVALSEANALPEAIDEPIPPEPGEILAGELYENVQILGHLTDANFNRLMLAITEWSAPSRAAPTATARRGISPPTTITPRSSPAT